MTVQEHASRPGGTSAATLFSTSPRDGRGREGLAFASTRARYTAWQWRPEGADAAPCLVLAYGSPGPDEQRPNAGDIADARPVTLPEEILDAIRSALGQAQPHDAGRFLTTVLMTDIIDSTGTAMRLGDRRWGEVLTAHYAACRAEVERGGGELVETTGDGVVAIFDGPARAVRAAMAIQASARASGIAVRAGVHTGECERLGDSLAGVAVHIAARICALGSADAVLTTGTVRDLAIGSMLAFRQQGHHELKGVPGSWPVFSASDSQ
jgi:class 3 adenylate cyclase